MTVDFSRIYLQMVYRWFHGQVMLEYLKRERAMQRGSARFEYSLAREDLKRSVAKLEGILEGFPAFKDDRKMWTELEETHKNELLRIVKSKLAGPGQKLNEGV